MTSPAVETVERIIVHETTTETVTVVEEPLRVEVKDSYIHAFQPVLEAYTYSFQGRLDRVVGDVIQSIEVPMELLTFRVNVTRPPAGGDVVVDLLCNGVSVWADHPENRPTIHPGQYTVLATLPTNVYFDAHDEFTVDVVDVGSIFPGGDLTATMRLQSIPVPA
jgi:hypothetical protein